MTIYSGRSVSGGIAIGKLWVWRRNERRIRRVGIDDPDEEMERFERAKAEAAAQLQDLYDKALREAGGESAAIFEIHRMMLEDEAYNRSVENIVRAQNVNAECAVASTADDFAGMFAGMEDDYMKARAADVRDISERLIAVLSGNASRVTPPGEPVIIVADDLSPSETVQLDRDKTLAFVTTQGSANSHTAILARTMGIPALVGVDIPLEGPMDGKTAVVDGGEGCVYVEPDEDFLDRMRERQRKELEQKATLRDLKGKESVTADGKRALLYANIGSLKDLSAALENDAEGIGLFRSEFLYLESEDFPTEEEQFLAYKTAAETMAGKRVIIRTLDIGADKQCDYFGLEPEENPALGLRGIRVCLTRTEMFKTQLRALFRASAFGKIAVMYPMIISVEEVRRIRELAEEARRELAAEGTPFGMPEQGIMIETPAAVMMSRELAKEVDFFSIGTNDLTQYALAIDRQNPRLDSFYDPRHPAVLRMIEMTAANARLENVRVGICGELAADTELTETFLKMGIDELSVAPGNILPLRKKVREIDLSGV